MKPIRCDIYWECIASKYLDIEDLARFEGSINNHIYRDLLLLKQPILNYFKLKNVCNPYETMILLDENIPVLLKSQKMLDWCQNRKLRLPNIILGFEPKSPCSSRKSTNHVRNMTVTITMAMTTTVCIAVRSIGYFINLLRMRNTLTERSSCIISCCENNWDVFHHVKTLHMIKWQYIFNYDQLFSRFQSLQSFSSESIVFLDSSIDALVKQCHLNSTIRNQSLTHVGFDILLKESFKSIISGIPSITSLKANRSVFNEDLIAIAKNWKNLSCLDITSCNYITDDSLINLISEDRSFRIIKFSYCAKITFDGIRSLVIPSMNTLIELAVDNVSEKDMLTIIPYMPRIERLELNSISTMTFLYSNQILLALGESCSQLKSFMVPIYTITAHRFSYSGIKALIKGCHQVKVLHLGSSYGFNYACLLIIATAYKDTLKEIYFMDYSFVTPLFQYCNHRVTVLRSNRATW